MAVLAGQWQGSKAQGGVHVLEHLRPYNLTEKDVFFEMQTLLSKTL